MPWVESHTVLLRHRKLRELALSLRLHPVYALGHLHALWHAALEQQEDGDLSRWSDEFLAESAGFNGDAPQFVLLLQQHGWLDGRLIHDWLNYAGRYLESKYRTADPGRLNDIWEKHGRVCLQSDRRRTKDSPPNQPNLTNQPKTPAPPRELTAVQQVVEAWKLQIGVDPEDKAWDKAHFARHLRAAEKLLALFSNDVGAVCDCIEAIHGKFVGKKGWDLSLDGVVKNSDRFRQEWLERKQKREVGRA